MWLHIRVQGGTSLNDAASWSDLINVQIQDNAKELLSVIAKLKPTAAKGTYMQTVTLSSTMSPAIKVDTKSID